jgi:hypothetical protein
MMLKSFADLVSELLRSYGMALPDGPPQEVYILHFDSQPPVHIVSRAESAHINVLVEAGRLAAPPSVDQLLALLELNTDKIAGQVAAVTLHRPSSTAVVWTRQPRTALNAEGLRIMLDTVRNHAEFVRQRLTMHAASAPRQSHSATRLQMLMQSKR